MKITSFLNVSLKKSDFFFSFSLLKEKCQDAEKEEKD